MSWLRDKLAIAWAATLGASVTAQGAQHFCSRSLKLLRLGVEGEGASQHPRRGPEDGNTLLSRNEPQRCLGDAKKITLLSTQCCICKCLRKNVCDLIFNRDELAMSPVQWITENIKYPIKVGTMRSPHALERGGPLLMDDFDDRPGRCLRNKWLGGHPAW